MCCIGQHILTHPEHTHSPAAPSKQQDVSLALTCQPACRQHAQRSHAAADGTAAGRYSGISLRLCAHGNFANVLGVSKLPERSDAVRKVEGQVLKGGHMTAAEQACDLAKAFVKDAGWQEVDCHQVTAVACLESEGADAAVLHRHAVRRGLGWQVLARHTACPRSRCSRPANVKDASHVGVDRAQVCDAVQSGL